MKNIKQLLRQYASSMPKPFIVIDDDTVYADDNLILGKVHS